MAKKHTGYKVLNF